MNTVAFLTIPAGIVPEQEAVVFDGQRFTYAEVEARVRRLAGALTRLGVGHGTRVAALDTNSHRYVESYYATALLGGVFIPVNYRAKQPELQHMLRAGEASVLLVGGRYVPAVEALLAAGEPVDAEADVEDDETTILMFTSGTTSLPKGVLLTYGDFSAYVTANVELADGTTRGAALLCAPLYHIAGATNMMTTLWTGRRLVIMAQFEARAWLDLVEREGVTHAFVVPTMMKLI